MNINGSNYELKKIKTFIGNEGHGLNATLIWNGVKVAFVLDDAGGGDIQVHWEKKPNCDYEAQLKEFLLALPGPLQASWSDLEKRQEGQTDEQYNFSLFDGRLNQLVDCIANEIEELKQLKRRAKNALLYRTPEQKPNEYWADWGRLYGELAVRHLLSRPGTCEVFDGTAWISLDAARQAFGI